MGYTFDSFCPNCNAGCNGAVGAKKQCASCGQTNVFVAAIFGPPIPVAPPQHLPPPRTKVICAPCKAGYHFVCMRLTSETCDCDSFWCNSPEHVRTAPTTVSEEKTYFTLLGVSQSVDEVTLRRAYLNACKTAHPDNGGSSEQFLAVKHAYDVLRDPKSRKKYLFALKIMEKDKAPELFGAAQSGPPQLFATPSALYRRATTFGWTGFKQGGKP